MRFLDGQFRSENWKSPCYGETKNVNKKKTSMRPLWSGLSEWSKNWKQVMNIFFILLDIIKHQKTFDVKKVFLDTFKI